MTAAGAGPSGGIEIGGSAGGQGGETLPIVPKKSMAATFATTERLTVEASRIRTRV